MTDTDLPSLPTSELVDQLATHRDDPAATARIDAELRARAYR